MLSVTSTSDPGRLVNLSCRAQVGTGGDILIAGFAAGGQGTSGSEPLLVRGSGPALAPFGVSGTLPTPQLQLFSGGTVLGTNNGWGGNPAVASAAASVGAFSWNNATSHDSALIENRSEEHTSELQSPCNLVCRLLLEKKKKPKSRAYHWLPNFTTTQCTSVHPQH